MTSVPITFERLFEPAFLAALSRWSLPVRRVAAGGRHGERLSLEAGAGLEFRDHRPYCPGDDLRAIDWNLFLRLRRVFTRVFDEEQDLPVYLLPDVSGSMFHDGDGPPAIITALRCALALAAAGLCHHDSAALLPFSSRLEVAFQPGGGRARLLPFARRLAALAAAAGGAPTSLGPSLTTAARMNLRRGLLVVISDFFDPGGAAALAAALRPLRHRVLLVQVTRPADAAPAVTGDVRLTDCETGDAADLTVTPGVLARYRAAYLRFNDELAAVARARRAGLLRVDAGAALLPQLARLLGPGGITP